jgi:hypothetical protein
MQTQHIEFKKQRELGEVLSDTFAFLRSQFKPFFGTYFKILGPYLVAMVVSLVLYMYYAGNTFNFMFMGAGGEVENLAVVLTLGIAYIFSLVVVYTLSQSITLHYIKSYANGHGKIEFNTVKKEVYDSFWSFIGLGILVGLSLFLGLMLCILPGVYLYVPLALSFSVMVFNRMGASDAYSYSFTLVKDEWWITFATLLVIGIIVAIANYAFSLPAQIYQIVKMGIFSGEVDAESMFDVFKDPIYILFNVISSVGQFLMNLISVIAGVFIYFNLNEKKNFTGTYERIENLGKATKG